MPERRAKRAKKEKVEVAEHHAPPLPRATGSKVLVSKATSYLEALVRTWLQLPAWVRAERLYIAG